MKVRSQPKQPDPDAERRLREAVGLAEQAARSAPRSATGAPTLQNVPTPPRRPSLAQRLLAKVPTALGKGTIGKETLGMGFEAGLPAQAPAGSRQHRRSPIALQTSPENEPARLAELAPAPQVQPVPMPASLRQRAEIGDREGVLSAWALGKSYKGRQVVKDVSLSVRRGEAVGLLGANGAGKTTAFYMITGLVPADKGRIILDGQDITGLPMYRRARLGIGYLPQEASIFRGLNVEDNIRAVLEVVEPNKLRREDRLDTLLAEFNIEALRKAPATALSGGERRRLEIARALASQPSFVLLDEPFAGIDPIAVGDIQDLVRQLTSRGIGVLITDHNVRETLGLIDRAYIMHSGQLLMEGTPEQIVASDEVRRTYLGADFRL